jgi:hypothetical protein
VGVDDFSYGLRIDVADVRSGAVGGEGARDRQADAARAGGDKDSLVMEVLPW